VSIHTAAYDGDLEIVKSQVQNVETLDDKGFNALYYAAQTGQNHVVEFLLDHGAKPDVLLGEESTPFHAAVWAGHLEITKLFISRKADIGCRDGDGRTVLHAAARRGYTEIAKLLVENGADIEAASSGGTTPIGLAAHDGSVDIVVFLAGEGANVNIKNQAGDSPSHIAASNGHTKVLKVLLNLGADINATGGSDRTLIYAAAVGGHAETVEFLADRGADLEKASSSGHSPLEAAIYFGKTETARLLHDKVAVARTQTDKFKSLVINTGCTPYAPFPSQLKLHETVIRGNKYIGSEANRKLYRIKATPPRAVAGTVSLHNGSSESATVMAQGGNIPGTLHEFIRIAILPDQVGTTIILRTSLLDDEQTVRFCFTTYKKVQQKDDPNSTTEEPLDFEWRIKQGEFSQGDAHELTLVQQKRPGSTIENIYTDPIAVAKISHPAGGFALPFELSLERSLDNPTIVTVIMTALLIGLRYNNGTATKSHVRARLGYKD
jgi:ankyrin repeat protein